ncbi:unnamed protein product [Microthlaspi erraticum]|uniref:Uncharacterized protein n=1 Tax=Microthlaspi erraticum TaxID=1685480 RepID=A0A6D2IDE2_9BRAS|nr:unnamed protein product [Microthlaspi erraticum]
MQSGYFRVWLRRSPSRSGCSRSLVVMIVCRLVISLALVGGSVSWVRVAFVLLSLLFSWQFFAVWMDCSLDFSRIFFHVASRASLHKRASMAHNTWFALLTKISPILPRTTKVDAKRKICSHNAEHLCRGQSCRGWQYKSIGMEHARLWS